MGKGGRKIPGALRGINGRDRCQRHAARVVSTALQAAYVGDELSDRLAENLADQLTHAHAHRAAIGYVRDQLRTRFELQGLDEVRIEQALMVGETGALIDAIDESQIPPEHRADVVEEISRWVRERRQLSDLR